MPHNIPKHTAKPSHVLYEETQHSARAVGWRYSWNNGETTDVLFEILQNTSNITADAL